MGMRWSFSSEPPFQGAVCVCMQHKQVQEQCTISIQPDCILVLAD